MDSISNAVFTCRECKAVLSKSSFVPRKERKVGIFYICRPCHNLKQKGYNRRNSLENPQYRIKAAFNTRVYVSKNREKVRTRGLERYRKLRLEIIHGYGGKCACCSETIVEFLELDHVNGGGTKHRKESGGHRKMYVLIKKLGFPPEFQILCSNCNQGRQRHGGICPHAIR